MKKKCIFSFAFCGVTLFLGLNLLQSKPDGLAQGRIDSQYKLTNSPDVKDFLQDRPYINDSRQILGPSPLNKPRLKDIIQINEDLLRMIREIREEMVVMNVSVTPFNISCNEKSRDGTEDLLCMVRRFYLLYLKVTSV